MDSIINDLNQISFLCTVDRFKDLDPLKLLSVLLQLIFAVTWVNQNIQSTYFNAF